MVRSVDYVHGTGVFLCYSGWHPSIGCERVAFLLDGVADMMANRWIGSEFVQSGEQTESKTPRHEGEQRHDILGGLHSSRGLLKKSSSMHVFIRVR